MCVSEQIDKEFLPQDVVTHITDELAYFSQHLDGLEGDKPLVMWKATDMVGYDQKDLRFDGLLL